MDALNFPGIIAKYRLLSANQLSQANDLLVIGKKVNDLRNGSQYQELAMTIQEFLSLIGSSAVLTDSTLSGTGVIGDALSVNGTYGNTLFVSPTGNDATAIKGKITNPYITLAGASAAATAGDTIHVLPGVYSGASLGKDLVNWWFYPGAAVINVTGSPIFTDSGAFTTFSVLGYGYFKSEGNILFASNPSSKIYFEMYYGSSKSNLQGIYARAGATINVVVHELLTHHITGAVGVYEALVRSDTGGAGAVGGKIYVSGTGALKSDGFIAQTKQGSNHNGIIVLNNTGGATITAGGSYRCTTEQNGGSIIINTDVTVLANSAYGLPVFRHEGEVGVFILNGKVTSVSSNNLIDCGVEGSIEVNGAVSATSQIRVSSASTKLVITGEVISLITSGPVLTLSAGNIEIKSRIKNLDNNAVSYGMTVSGTPTVILNGAVIVTTNAAASSIYAAAPVNVIVYTAFGNIAPDVNVTALVGTFVTNVNVQ